MPAMLRLCYTGWGIDAMTYQIIRFYAPHLDRSNRVIKRGLTLEQAQAHCKHPSTRKDGEWFDGYAEA